MAGSLIAGEYTGPPALTLSSAVTSWTLDLPVLVAVLVAAGLYLAGMRRLHRAGLPCRYQEWIGGHDGFWWDQQLPAALAWLLAPP